jgi:hypothetical protein
MTQPITRLAIVLSLLAAGPAPARAQHVFTNVNTRYEVESVSVTGVPEARLSATLRDDMQKLVGAKYDPDATDALADRMRRQLGDYTVSSKVRRGDHPDHVKVTFDVERARGRRFEVQLPPLLFYAHEGFSGALVPGFDTHHNHFSVGLVSNADDLLERNTGVLLRYEHRRVGTDAVQVGVEYDRYHPSFDPATADALANAPDVPGIYRTREVFAPSVSVIPIPEVKLTAGASFQTLTFQYPEPNDRAAHAFTFDLQFRQRVRTQGGFRHTFRADYGLRYATSSLGSDFLYTRHHVSGDYTVSIGRHLLGFHGQAGDVSGRAPLFERFSLGNSMMLRGWDKFDVAPLGGSRLVYGSIEYRYRPFQIFYDVGSVWDPGQTAEVRHSIGIGLVTKDGFFLSLGFPVRLHHVTPLVMFGFRG